MTSLRSLLVHIDGSARSATRLEVASCLATTHRTSLTALCAASPPLRSASDGSAAQGAPIGLLERLYSDLRARARAQFEQARPAAASWRSGPKYAMGRRGRAIAAWRVRHAGRSP